MNNSLTMHDRIQLYNNGLYGRKYPSSVFWDVGGWPRAYWMLGNNYRSSTGFYGSYPPEYIGRVMSMFPDVVGILHAFSGSLPPGRYTRVDISSANNPDYVASIDNLPFPDGTFDIAMADPPYDRSDSEKYGTAYPNKPKCLRELTRVVKHGGYIIWLDTRKPMYRKVELELCCVIAIDRSTNHRIRGCWIFRKPLLVDTEVLTDSGVEQYEDLS